MSCRSDVTEMLEKRVKSRFSYRRQLILDSSSSNLETPEEGPCAILGSFLALKYPAEATAEDTKFAACFNANVNKALEDPDVIAALKKLCNHGECPSCALLGKLLSSALVLTKHFWHWARIIENPTFEQNTAAVLAPAEVSWRLQVQCSGFLLAGRLFCTLWIWAQATRATKARLSGTLAFVALVACAHIQSPWQCNESQKMLEGWGFTGRETQEPGRGRNQSSLSAQHGHILDAALPSCVEHYRSGCPPAPGFLPKPIHAFSCEFY